MCVKILFGNLNLNPYSSHPTSTYTCRVTTVPKVRGGGINNYLKTNKASPSTHNNGILEMK